MMKFSLISLIIFLITLATLLAGCEVEPQPEVESQPTVYLYYDPECPISNLIMPYMHLLRKETKGADFDFCDVTNASLCSGESVKAARDALRNVVIDGKGKPKPYFCYTNENIRKETGIDRTPTVIVRYLNDSMVFPGLKAIEHLPEKLEELGVSVPEHLKSYNYSLSVE